MLARTSLADLGQLLRSKKTRKKNIQRSVLQNQDFFGFGPVKTIVLIGPIYMYVNVYTGRRGHELLTYILVGGLQKNKHVVPQPRLRCPILILDCRTIVQPGSLLFTYGLGGVLYRKKDR